MIDDVRLCFICQAETGTCNHLEPDLRRHMQREQKIRMLTEPQDDQEKALKREYLARVVKHRRFGPRFVNPASGA